VNRQLFKLFHWILNFFGNLGSMYRQVGNAVPVLFAKQIAQEFNHSFFATPPFHARREAKRNEEREIHKSCVMIAYSIKTDYWIP
jgi:hypothetical protein